MSLLPPPPPAPCLRSAQMEGLALMAPSCGLAWKLQPPPPDLCRNLGLQALPWCPSVPLIVLSLGDLSYVGQQLSLSLTSAFVLPISEPGPSLLSYPPGFEHQLTASPLPQAAVPTSSAGLTTIVRGVSDGTVVQLRSM